MYSTGARTHVVDTTLLLLSLVLLELLLMLRLNQFALVADRLTGRSYTLLAVPAFPCCCCCCSACRLLSVVITRTHGYVLKAPVPHNRIAPQKSLPRPTIYRQKSAPPGGRPGEANFWVGAVL